MKEQLRYRREMECWRPNREEMNRRMATDMILGKMIMHAKPHLDDRIADHVLRFKAHRQANPRHVPGWLEQQDLNKKLARHAAVVNGVGISGRIDNAPPVKALQYAKFLRNSRFTKGGTERPRRQRRSSPRQRDGLPKVDGRQRQEAKRRRRAKGVQSLPELSNTKELGQTHLPPRRSRAAKGSHRLIADWKASATKVELPAVSSPTASAELPTPVVPPTSATQESLPPIMNTSGSYEVKEIVLGS